LSFIVTCFAFKSELDPDKNINYDRGLKELFNFAFCLINI